MAVEQPVYAIVQQDGAFQLRDYAAYLIAETNVEADFAAAGSEGFRRLFAYISGHNAVRQKIAMTAPVTQVPGENIAMTAPVTQAAAGSGYRVAFVVPSRYTAATVPAPLDPRVEIRAVPAQRVAAWHYPGNWTQDRHDEMERRLREAIAARRLRPLGPPVLARYDPPFMPSFLRRNEVLIPVANA